MGLSPNELKDLSSQAGEGNVEGAEKVLRLSSKAQVVETDPNPPPARRKPGPKPGSRRQAAYDLRYPPVRSARPLGPFIFPPDISAKLAEVFVWYFMAVDLGCSLGLGIDTATAPIWAITIDEAMSFVRILERRAESNPIIPQKIVPQLLASRDYFEAGIILAPRFVATVRAVVEGGGIKPRLFGGKSRSQSATKASEPS